MTAAPAGVATVRPDDLREARDAVRDSAGTLLFRGGGTKQDWGGPVESVDTIVDTGGLDALVEHSAGDMIAIVAAGLPLFRLQDELAPAGQWLALDPPLADEGATLGGLFAANDAGPRRQRYGSLRDLVIGVTVVLADGAVARGGGRVVKNVAGFDLMRLLCGSLGTLGLVTELIVRLHPRPEASRTLRVVTRPRAATELVLALLASQVVAAALDADQDSLWVRLEGRQAGVDEQAEAVRRLAREHGADDVTVLEAADEQRAWQRMAVGHAGEPGETVARAATLPDRLASVAEAAADAAAKAGVDVGMVSHAGLGLHTGRFRGGDGQAHAAAVRDWRRRVAGYGGSVVVRRRADGADVEPWPAVDPGAMTLMRRVKAQLDPDRRCAPGRFVGGI